MRLSWAILTTHSIILLLSGLAIGMEVMAFVNDLKWNEILDSKNPEKKLPYSKFRKCELYYSNGSVLFPTRGMYEEIFKAKKRDLPYELPFLILICFSFLMYLVAMSVYISCKKILANIYICIVTNVVGIMIHSASFALILTSTILYTRKSSQYMGNDFCYAFDCVKCPDQKDYRERSKSMHEESRNCLEDLGICQITGFKDRIVYLIFGCFICSCVALGSSVRRLGRHQGSKVVPRRAVFQPSAAEKTDGERSSVSSYSVPRPSIDENIKWKISSGTTGTRIRESYASSPL